MELNKILFLKIAFAILIFKFLAFELVEATKKPPMVKSKSPSFNKFKVKSKSIGSLNATEALKSFK